MPYTLNIKLLLNQQFDKACEAIYSPRNAFCISRDDGMFNNDVNIIKDTIINLEAFQHMTRNNYTKEQLDKINKLKEKYKDVV